MCNRPFALLLTLCLFATAAWAQAPDANKNKPPAADQQIISPPAMPIITPTLQEQLRQLLDSIDRKERDLDTMRQQRARMEGSQATDMDKEIESAAKQLSDLRQQFIQLATDDFSFNIATYNQTPQFDINWQQDLIQVIYPLLRELKHLTERPRMIEQLNGEINFYREHLDSLNKGEEHVDALIANTKDPKLLQGLKLVAKKIAERKSDVDQKLSGLERQLEDMQQHDEPLWPSIRDGMRTFATSVILYLLLATLAAFASYYLLRLLGQLPLRLIAADQMERWVFVERSGRLLTKVISIIGSLIVFLMVLYAVGAWVLLALTVIVILGLLFSLKNLVPDYLVELRTLFNLGSVRQGERLVYNNLPWRVQELDVYTLLYNPALGGLMRVPLTKISHLSSRPFNKEEPWFPTQVGDFVQLSDGISGRIEQQTPEMVMLNIGEAQMTYRTEQFLTLRPNNLSARGFSVSTEFGIGYRHQREVSTHVVEIFRSELREAMAHAPFAKFNTSSFVELKSVGASSLVFILGATFKGGAAEYFSSIQRWLQATAVECANKHDWEIPLPQIVVHQDNAQVVETAP